MTTTAPPRRLAIAAAPAPGPGPTPAEVISAARYRATAPPADPPLRGMTTGAIAPLPSPPPLAEVLVWVATATRTAGQPVNVTVSAATYDAHVHVADAATFRAWCEALKLPLSAVRWPPPVLGPMAEATAVVSGWAIHVRLFGPATQELR